MLSVFLSVLFRPRGTLHTQDSSCLVLSVLFVCSFRPRGTLHRTPAVWCCLFFLSVFVRASKYIHYVGLQLFGIVCFFVCVFRAPRYTTYVCRTPAVWYCLFFLSVLFGPRGTLHIHTYSTPAVEVHYTYMGLSGPQPASRKDAFRALFCAFTVQPASQPSA